MNHWWGMALALTVAIGTSGCSRGPELAGVEGRVTLDDKPLADLEVQFVPDPEQGTEGRPSSGYTDADGRYRIAIGSDTGVVVGTHRVCINDTTLHRMGGNAVENEEGIVDGSGPSNSRPQRASRSRIPGVYSDITKTPFRSTKIESGGMQTLDFQLKSNPSR